MSLPEKNVEMYLGDGLYGIFDGWSVVLRTQRDGITHWVCLEPEVMSNLLEWTKRIVQHVEARQEGSEP